MPASDADLAMRILKQVRALALRYYRLTGRPLGVTGELGEYEAIRLLGLSPAMVRQRGFDATRQEGKQTIRLQIKTRRLSDMKKGGQKLGSISLEKPWDRVILVLLDDEFHPLEIHEAERRGIAKALQLPGSRSRNERGQLTVSKVRSIGRVVWKRNPPPQLKPLARNRRSVRHRQVP